MARKRIEMEKCAAPNCSMFCKKGDVICDLCILARYKLEATEPPQHERDDYSYSRENVCAALREAELYGKHEFARMF